jgi:hypothetical protein
MGPELNFEYYLRKRKFFKEIIFVHYEVLPFYRDEFEKYHLISFNSKSLLPFK